MLDSGQGLSLVFLSGVYLLPEAIKEEFDGDTVISVRFCGIHKSDLNANFPSSPTLYLYILILRTMDNNHYVLRYKPLMVRLKYVNNVCDMDPVTLASLDSEARWIVRRGDRLGVYIPPGPVDTCIDDTDSVLYPAYVEVRTNNTSNTVYYYNQTIQNLQSGNPAGVVFLESMHLNVEFTLADSKFNYRIDMYMRTVLDKSVL